jgi:hypothetical protein
VKLEKKERIQSERGEFSQKKRRGKADSSNLGEDLGNFFENPMIPRPTQGILFIEFIVREGLLDSRPSLSLSNKNFSAESNEWFRNSREIGWKSTGTA